MITLNYTEEDGIGSPYFILKKNTAYGFFSVSISDVQIYYKNMSHPFYKLKNENVI